MPVLQTGSMLLDPGRAPDGVRSGSIPFERFFTGAELLNTLGETTLSQKGSRDSIHQVHRQHPVLTRAKIENRGLKALKRSISILVHLRLDYWPYIGQCFFRRGFTSHAIVNIRSIIALNHHLPDSRHQ